MDIDNIDDLGSSHGSRVSQEEHYRRATYVVKNSPIVKVDKVTDEDE